MTSTVVSQPSILQDSYRGGTLVNFEHKSAEIIGYHCCGMPEDVFEDVNAWLHELIEMFLWDMPLMRNSVIDREFNTNPIAHIVAAICHGANVGGIYMSGDGIWERFFAE